MKIHMNCKVIFCMMLIALVLLGCSQNASNPRDAIPSEATSSPILNTVSPVPETLSPILNTEPPLMDAKQLILEWEEKGIMGAGEILNNSMGDYLYSRVQLTDYYYLHQYAECVAQVCCRIVFEVDDFDLIYQWLKEQHYGMDLYEKNDPYSRQTAPSWFYKWQNDFEDCTEWHYGFRIAPFEIYIITDPPQSIPITISIPFCFVKNAAGKNILLLNIAHDAWEMRDP